MILETIPGRHFRSRQAHQGKSAAHRYFRQIIENQFQPNLQLHQKVKEVLGDSYHQKYDLLRYIPPEQLTKIDSLPFSRGKYGAVYGAIWKRPVLGKLVGGSEDSLSESTDVQVVIKMLKDQASFKEEVG